MAMDMVLSDDESPKSKTVSRSRASASKVTTVSSEHKRFR